MWAIPKFLLDGDRFFGRSNTAHRAQMPFAGRKLPEKSAVLLRKNSLVVNEPLNVAGHRRCEFDHLLRRLQDRINLVACIRRRTGDAKLGSDVRADLHSSAPPIWTVRSLIIGFILGLRRQDAAKAVNDVTIIAVDNVPI